MNLSGRSPLNDATYHISRLYILWFQIRLYFNYISQIVKHVTPMAVPFLAPGP